MRRSHFAAWTPHCPACARDRGDTSALVLVEGATAQGDDVLDGTLVCAAASCRAEYPIIDGIPIITATLRQTLGERAIELLVRDDIGPAALSMLGDALGPDSWLDAMRQGLSTYAWDAYADLDPAEAPAESSGAIAPGAGRRCLHALLAMAPAADQDAAPGRVLDLGCAAGRTAFDCAAAFPGALVLGIDANLALMRLARRVATRNQVAYGRRRIGLVYDERRFEAVLPGHERVDFWACDAAALPFVPGHADLVVALNLLDCVPDPVKLLHGMARALRPGGRLLMSTPFDWAARATPMEHWLGGHSQRGETAGAAEPLLRMLLQDGAHDRSVPGMELVATADHEWHTRLHDRSTVLYRSHLAALRCRNGMVPPGQGNVTR